MNRKMLLLSVTGVLVLAQAAAAHDTWVEPNSNLVRTGDGVTIALKLGNHGNDHRDFRLAGKVKPEATTLQVLTPGGRSIDLKPGLIDEGYTPAEGYWSVRCRTAEPGMYRVIQSSDSVVSYAPKRSIKSAKTFFVASDNLDRVTENNPGFDDVAGHPFELIPVTNPVTPMGPGTVLTVELRLHGKPQSNARVSFIPRGAMLTESFDDRYERLTDASGRASLELREATTWLIVAHHEDPQAGGDGYDSTKYSATMTILVPDICPCCGD